MLPAIVACHVSLIAFCCLLLAGCGERDTGLPRDARTAAVDQQVRAKWGKGLDELPTVSLIILSANNENILDEFEWAFSLHHAVAYGQTVTFDRRDVGGGGTSMETALLNNYTRGQTPGFDILWGGGDTIHMNLARGGRGIDGTPTGPLLETLTLADDVLENIPAEFAGTPMRDGNLRWVGSAMSGFGILYNKGILEKIRRQPPRDWQDLGDDRFLGLVELADSQQSGSAAAVYRTIVISDDWPAGWHKLLAVLGNVHRFADSAGSAANAPALGEAPLATCIDFYGAMRVMEAPDQLVYFTPPGQSIFTSDPIAILKGAPNRDLAQRFVDFVVSPAGQALWALPVGAEGGPVRKPLGRQPIRRDTYTQLAGRMLPFITDPYEQGQAIVLTAEKNAVDFKVLRELVGAAAITNRQGLAAAKAAIVRSNHRPDLVAEFNALPQNVATLDAIQALAKELREAKGNARIDALRDEWQQFFREKYQRIRDTEKSDKRPVTSDKRRQHPIEQSRLICSWYCEKTVQLLAPAGAPWVAPAGAKNSTACLRQRDCVDATPLRQTPPSLVACHLSLVAASGAPS